MGCYGTKCADDASYKWKPETLGSIYRELIQEYGLIQLNKPIPGEFYRKVYKPLSAIDRPAFRRLPENIMITQPARLYRSHGYKYGGRVYLEAECFWQFEYEYEYGLKRIRDWMPVRLLTTCYINQTLTFPQPKKTYHQLELF